MTQRTTAHRLQVATVLHRFVEEQVLPGTGIDSAAFWKGFDEIAHDLGPKTAAMLHLTNMHNDGEVESFLFLIARNASSFRNGSATSALSR